MKAKANTTLSLNGTVFNFTNIKVTETPNWLYVPTAGVGQVIRQYVKQKWGVKVQISSDTFAGGDSVNVYLPCVGDDLAKEISSELRGLFSAGHFNGMIDLYEYKPADSFLYIEHNGKKADVSAKYISVENRPKWGTKLYEEYTALKLV
jgi:hypothetical protein